VEGKPDPVTELVNQLTRLPGIGEKTATRLAFFLLRAPEGLSRDLANAVQQARQRVRHCGACGMLTESDPCRVCSDARRDAATICVVESTPDVVAIERTAEFRGTYHVLHGLIRPLDGIGPSDLNLDPLIRRIGGSGIAEVIVATNPSVEGEATAMYVQRLLTPLGVKVTRIARGLPMGGELEYADRATLGRAIADRIPL